jgi:AraC-like DNA-binding protein
MQLHEFSSWMPERWESAPLDEWREQLRSICGRYSPLVSKDTSIVTGGVSLFDVAGTEIVQVATDVDEVRRDRRDIRLDHGDHLFLLLQLEGSCGIEQQGELNVVSPGDCILADSSLPMTFYFNGRFSNHLSVHLPRQLLLAEKSTRIEISRKVQAQDPMAVILRALVAQQLRTGIDHKRAAQLRQLLLHATRTAFSAESPDNFAPANERTRNRLELAQILVDRHLTEDFLVPQWLAARLGISMRTLQEDFNTIGETVTSFIRDRRLRLARDRLVDMQLGGDGTTIADIAYSSGFKDVSYFNRCFKRAFDCSPKDVART